MCAVCKEPPLMTEHVGLCQLCPRIICSRCLAAIGSVEVAAAALIDPELAGIGAPDGHVEGSDIVVPKCPHCLRESDLALPPPPGTFDNDKRAHLLDQLLKHDLSLWFRAPVDVNMYTGYLTAVPRERMMDLGTMVCKRVLQKYDSTRGSAAFYLDLSRVFDNCRAFAGCDREGKPLVGGDEATVPGIVRCVFILEKLAKEFVWEHIPRDAPVLPRQWETPSWNPAWRWSGAGVVEGGVRRSGGGGGG